jgi:hypothetical protein
MASPAEPAPPSKEAPPERVAVELVSTDPLAVLERRPERLSSRGDLAGVDGWQGVCVAPCRAEVDRGDGLRVGGSSVDPLYFYLPEGPGPYRVRAETGSGPSEAAGLALVVAGASMVMLGAVTTVVLATGPLKNAGPDEAPTVLFHASITSLILGGVVLAVGVPFRLAGGGEVWVEPQGEGAAPSPPSAAAELRVGDGVYLTPSGVRF